MDKLTPAQAHALFDAGGFVIISGLPQGSEFGMDGTYHVTRRFSGIKFLPPGLHLVTWSPPPSATPGPSTIPIKSALLRITKSKERVLLSYNAQTENVTLSNDEEETVISDDHLRTLDPELAPYPFDGLHVWSALTNQINQSVLEAVIGTDGRVDGMMLVDGEEDELSELNKAKRADGRPVLDPSRLDTKRLRFPNFDLKRSWRSGAVGDEVTRYSRDKSWLLGDLVVSQFDNDPIKIISYIQLSFLLLLHLSSYSSLMVYKRFLSLVTRASDLLSDPSSYLPSRTTRDIATLYSSFLQTLCAQLSVLPEQVFESELPEMDLFFQDELAYLRQNLGQGIASWIESDRDLMESSWKSLQDVVKRWKWDIPPISTVPNEDEEDEEEGEYAPVIVET